MKTVLTCLFFVVWFCLSAQEPANNNADLTTRKEPIDSLKFDSLKVRVPEYTPYLSDIDLSTIHLSDFAPSIEIDMFEGIKMSTHIPIHHSDYLYSNVYGSFALGNNSRLNTARTNNFYYGLGTISTASATFNYNLGDFGVFSAGAYLTKYNINQNFYNGTGFNGNLKIPLNDRISINAFGQYSLTDNKAFNPYQGMYPTTNFGGSMEIKVTEKWGINAGMVREWTFDPMRGSFRWVNRPFIIPVFY